MAAKDEPTSKQCIIIDDKRVPVVNLILNNDWIDRLEMANGRRRTRVLTIEDVLYTVARAYKDGWAVTASNCVANSYNYSACRTVCVAGKRRDNKIRVGIRVGNAKKGSSPITPIVPGVRRGSNEEIKIMEWANRYEEERIVEVFEKFGNFTSLR